MLQPLVVKKKWRTKYTYDSAIFWRKFWALASFLDGLPSLSDGQSEEYGSGKIAPNNNCKFCRRHRDDIVCNHVRTYAPIYTIIPLFIVLLTKFSCMWQWLDYFIHFNINVHVPNSFWDKIFSHPCFQKVNCFLHGTIYCPTKML